MTPRSTGTIELDGVTEEVAWEATYEFDCPNGIDAIVVDADGELRYRIDLIGPPTRNTHSAQVVDPDFPFIVGHTETGPPIVNRPGMKCWGSSLLPVSVERTTLRISVRSPFPMARRFQIDVYER